MNHNDYITNFSKHFAGLEEVLPWHIIRDLNEIVRGKLRSHSNDYIINGETMIHKSAVVEGNVMFKGPVIVHENCFIGANAYLRGGVYVGSGVTVGPGCEVKSCIILDNSSLAHFNFAGDSIIGSRVNMEAGSVLANYHNDRSDKTITMTIEHKKVNLDVTKFGSYIGDGVKIGANAVCCPGTLLMPGTIVKRLQLVDQDPK